MLDQIRMYSSIGVQLFANMIEESDLTSFLVWSY